MANPEHVAKLKEGVEAWNAWRKQNQAIKPDLREASLSEADLGWANLGGADLIKADLSRAYLFNADLSRADLSRADLSRANLTMAMLREANLSVADLSVADLTMAILRRANLRRAILSMTILRDAHLGGANFANAHLYETIFANTYLKDAKGLKSCFHKGPSTIDNRTLKQSGKLPLPLAFLQGCGLSDWEIESAKLYQPGLTHQQITDIVYRIDTIRAESPIQIHNLFISYTHVDSPFVKHLEDHLKKRHVRFWRDVHDAPAGPLEKIVVRAMRHNPTVLLILSARSVESDWVEFEAKQARKLEKELDRHVLCPVALDDSWKNCKWPMRLRDQIEKYHILDFSCWQDSSVFKGMFERLLTGLDLFYEKDQTRQI